MRNQKRPMKRSMGVEWGEDVSVKVIRKTTPSLIFTLANEVSAVDIAQEEKVLEIGPQTQTDLVRKLDSRVGSMTYPLCPVLKRTINKFGSWNTP